MLKAFFLFAILLPILTVAQVKITGKVINQDSKMPVANVSVFLNNSIAGDKTADNGTFSITNVRPGKYDLIVSMVGYETLSQTLLINGSNLELPEIGIKPKTILLQEVNIKPDPDREKYYAIFKRQFLGESPNAWECKILNPDELYLEYDKLNMVLTASSFNALVIENKALGYRITYNLTHFNYQEAARSLYYEGTSKFELLKGSQSTLRKWKKHRQEAYLGSSMHFLRSVIADQLTNEGFKVLRLIKKPNPDHKDGLNDKYIQTLVNVPLVINDFAKLTDQPGLFALSFKDYLYVMYTKKIGSSRSLGSYHTQEFTNYPTTVLTFDEPNAYFDHNGVITNPHSIIFEGDWGMSRITELLPVDYMPLDKEN